MIIVWSIVLGLGISLTRPAVFTLLGEVVPASRVGTGYGLLTTIFNLGVFFGIPLIGQVRDLTSSYSTSFIIMAIVMASAAVVSGITMRTISK